MDNARHVLERILAHQEPFPAMVLDGAWNVVMKNNASAQILARCVDEPTLRQRSTDGRLNFMRMMFDPHGMRPRVRSWDYTGPLLIARLRREAAGYPGSPSETLLKELLPSVPDTFIPVADDAPLAPTIFLELDTTEGPLRLLNTLTTFGTAQDVTLQELRIEMSFPADNESESLLNRWAKQT